MRNTRAQVTIFIIIGIVIVAAILMIMYFSGVIDSSNKSTKNPKGFIEDCMLNSVKESEQILLESNLYPNSNSDNYIVFNKEKIPFLCTASEFYSTCVPQDPAMFLRIKNIMENKVARDVDVCLKKMYKDLRSEDYTVTNTRGVVKVDIFKDAIKIDLNETLHVAKGDSSYDITKFSKTYSTSFYDMIKLAQTIVNYETTFCEFNKLNWMNSNNGILIYTTRTSDQTKVYTLRDRLTEREIKFAIKTCVYRLGYNVKK